MQSGSSFLTHKKHHAGKTMVLVESKLTGVIFVFSPRQTNRIVQAGAQRTGSSQRATAK
jgi:hypothetical protein